MVQLEIYCILVMHIGVLDTLPPLFSRGRGGGHSEACTSRNFTIPPPLNPLVNIELSSPETFLPSAERYGGLHKWAYGAPLGLADPTRKQNWIGANNAWKIRGTCSFSWEFLWFALTLLLNPHLRHSKWKVLRASPITVVSRLIADRHFSEGNSFQLQIQSCAARRIAFYYGARSEGVLVVDLSLQITASPLNSKLFSLRIQTSGSKHSRLQVYWFFLALPRLSRFTNLAGNPPFQEAKFRFKRLRGTRTLNPSFP